MDGIIISADDLSPDIPYALQAAAGGKNALPFLSFYLKPKT
jgi:hypothetical protein